MGDALPAGLVLEFTDLYYELRFNPHSATAQIVPRLDRLIRRIETAVKGANRSHAAR